MYLSPAEKVALNFNSRSCEGATNPHEYGVLRDWISTHAPVKERLFREGSMIIDNYFNSRSCEGATKAPEVYTAVCQFQLTLL